MNYAGRRKQLIESFLATSGRRKSLEFIKDYAELTMPVRVNFSGTWTDALPYCIDNGGEVINMSVSVNGRLPIFISAQRLDEPVIELESDGDKTEMDIGELDFAYTDDCFVLHKTALKVFGVNSSTSLPGGLRLSTRFSEIRRGSGLGASSILIAGCLKVLCDICGTEMSEEEIIYRTFVAEQMMGVGGGWQDQAAGIYPGLNLVYSAKGLRQQVRTESIAIDESFIETLGSRLILVYTGQSHLNHRVVGDIMSKYISGDPAVCGALEKLRELNKPVKEALEKSDLNQLASLLDRQFDYLKELSGFVTNSRIETIAEKCREIADGLCICGAGAGGYLLLVLKEGITQNEIDAFSRDGVFRDIPQPVVSIRPYGVK